MKKKIFIVIATVLVMALVFGACNNNNNNNNTTPSTGGSSSTPGGSAPAPGSDFAAKPDFTLVLTSHETEGSRPAELMNAWAVMVYEKSKGRLEISVNHGGALAGPVESLDKVRGGSVDLAWGLQLFYPGQFPLSDALSIPFLPYKSSAHASKVMMDLWENTDFLNKEYEDVKVLLIRATSESPLSTASKKLGSAADMKGMTFRSTGTFSNAWLTKLGANGAGCPIGELAQNLSQGTFDGTTSDWHAINFFGLYEVVGYVADEGVMYYSYYFLMNKDSYNRLPADLQAVIDECSGQAALEHHLDTHDTIKAVAIDKVKSAGGEIYKLPDAENKKLRDAAKEVVDDWLAAGGPTEKAFYDALLASIEKNK